MSKEYDELISVLGEVVTINTVIDYCSTPEQKKAMKRTGILPDHLVFDTEDDMFYYFCDILENFSRIIPHFSGLKIFKSIHGEFDGANLLSAGKSDFSKNCSVCFSGLTTKGKCWECSKPSKKSGLNSFNTAFFSQMEYNKFLNQFLDERYPIGIPRGVAFDRHTPISVLKSSMPRRVETKSSTLQEILEEFKIYLAYDEKLSRTSGYRRPSCLQKMMEYNSQKK